MCNADQIMLSFSSVCIAVYCVVGQSLAVVLCMVTPWLY